MKIRELNHVALHVADLERSVRFYGGTLGLAPLPRPAFSFPGAWFALGAHQELHLIGGRSEPVRDRPRGDHYALAVESIEETRAALQARGVQMNGPIQRPDGAWQIFIRDPDGHVVELCELP